MQDLTLDRTGFATYTLADFCLNSGVLCLPTPNFQPALLNKPPSQDRFGLLRTHSAKPISPPPDFLRNFSNRFSHSDVYKVCPKNESPPLAAPSTISSFDIDCPPLYYRASSGFVHQDPLRMSVASPPAPSTTVTEAKKLENSRRTPHGNAYLSNIGYLPSTSNL